MTVFKLSQKKIWITKDKTLRWLKTSERGYDGECVCASQVKIGKKWSERAVCVCVCVCVCVWLIAIRATIRIHWRQTVSYWSSGIMLSITTPPSFPSPLPSLHHSHAITVLIRPSPAGTSFSLLPSSSPLHWSPSWLFSSLLFFFVFCLFPFFIFRALSGLDKEADLVHIEARTDSGR